MSVVEPLELSEGEDRGGKKLIHALESESAFNIIKSRAEAVNMKVNDNKTTLLCMNASRRRL